MGLTSKYLSRLFLGICYILLITLYLVLTNSTAGATSYSLTGKVTSTTNTNVANTAVTALFPGTGTVMFGPALTNSSGNYTLPVDLGTYDIVFDPGFTSLMNPAYSTDYTISGNQVLNKQLSAKIVTMSGTVTDSTSNPVQSATVRVTGSGINGSVNVSTTTDASGNYSLDVAAGSAYYLQVSGTGILGMQNFTYTSSTASLNLSQSITRNLQIPTTTISATAYNNTGQVHGFSTVQARTTTGTASLYSGDGGGTLNINSGSVVTNMLGQATFNTIVGATYAALGRDMTNPVGSICSLVNQSGTFKYDCLTSAVTATSPPNSVSVPSSPPVSRTFSGTLTDGSGNPMSNVTIILKKYADNSPIATTDSSGNFSISAEPNTYYLSLSGNSINGMANFTLTQSSATHSIDLRTSNMSQSLQIPTVELAVTAYELPAHTLYYNTSVNAKANGGTAYLYTGDPGHTTQVTSNGFGTTLSATGTIGTIVGAHYAANGLNTTNTNGSVCVRKNPTAHWDCLTSAYSTAGAASLDVPY